MSWCIIARLGRVALFLGSGIMVSFAALPGGLAGLIVVARLLSFFGSARSCLLSALFETIAFDVNFRSDTDVAIALVVVLPRSPVVML